MLESFLYQIWKEIGTSKAISNACRIAGRVAFTKCHCQSGVDCSWPNSMQFVDENKVASCPHILVTTTKDSCSAFHTETKDSFLVFHNDVTPDEY
jgi:hypothetical protein